MKDVLLVIALLLAVGLSVVVVRFNEKAVKASKSLQEERYSRMVAEETLQKKDASITVLETKLKDADAKMTKIQDILDQEETLNSDLKKQYEKLVQTKADLEDKLKNAISNSAQPVPVTPAEATAVPVEQPKAQ